MTWFIIHIYIYVYYIDNALKNTRFFISVKFIAISFYCLKKDIEQLNRLVITEFWICFALIQVRLLNCMIWPVMCDLKFLGWDKFGRWNTISLKYHGKKRFPSCRILALVNWKTFSNLWRRPTFLFLEHITGLDRICLNIWCKFSNIHYHSFWLLKLNDNFKDMSDFCWKINGTNYVLWYQKQEKNFNLKVDRDRKDFYIRGPFLTQHIILFLNFVSKFGRKWDIEKFNLFWWFGELWRIQSYENLNHKILVRTQKSYCLEKVKIKQKKSVKKIKWTWIWFLIWIDVYVRNMFKFLFSRLIDLRSF